MGNSALYLIGHIAMTDYTDEQVAVLNAARDANLESARRLRVLLEIMRGQHSSMDYAIDHLASIIDDLEA